MTQSSLDSIALGEATPDEARAAIGAALQPSATPDAVERVYTVLRTFVWKALDGRRRDGELRAWFDILRRTRAFLAESHPLQAERLHVLHDMLRESINASEVLSAEDVMRRSHVRHILAVMRDDAAGPIDRATIGQRVDLKQANLSRILNMMSSAGLIERTSYGKQAFFQLTRSGLRFAADLAAVPRVPEAGETVKVPFVRIPLKPKPFIPGIPGRSPMAPIPAMPHAAATPAGAPAPGVFFDQGLLGWMTYSGIVDMSMKIIMAEDIARANSEARQRSREAAAKEREKTLSERAGIVTKGAAHQQMRAGYLTMRSAEVAARVRATTPGKAAFKALHGGEES
jgi:predicted transcriptional regulator